MAHLKTNKTDYKKFLLKLLSATLVVLMLLPLFVACSDKPTNNNGGDDTNGTNNNNTVTDEYLIRECVETFLTAYNEGDMDAVLECLDAKSRNAMEAMLNLLGGVAGSYAGFDIDLKDLFSIGVSTVDEDFMLLDIISVEMRGSSEAVVTTSMSLPGGMNEEKAYFIMVYEKGKWCISDITDKKGGVSNDNQNGSGNINITEIDYTVWGNEILTYPYIVFTEGSKEYAGVLNMDGEIFYYIEGDYINYVWTGKDSILTREYVDADMDYYHYDIINSNGEIVATSRNGDFDTVIGYGNNLVLVYKNTSTISKEERSYGVIDATAGEWRYSLSSGSKLPETKIGSAYADDWSSFQYLGNDTWMSQYENSYWGGVVLYNSDDNKLYYIDNAIAYDGDFVDNYYAENKIYLSGDGDDMYLYDSFVGDHDEGQDLGAYCTFYFDGRFENADEFHYQQTNGKIFLSTVEDNGHTYYKIHNTYTNSSGIYKNFECDSIYTFQFFNDFVIFYISGADGNRYFTATNSIGEQQFEPIEISYYDSVICSQGRIVYKKPNTTCYEMIDMQGNVVVSSDAGYEEIFLSKTNGIAYVTNSTGEKMAIGLDGNPITISLKKD